MNEENVNDYNYNKIKSMHSLPQGICEREKRSPFLKYYKQQAEGVGTNNTSLLPEAYSNSARK